MPNELYSRLSQPDIYIVGIYIFNKLHIIALTVKGARNTGLPLTELLISANGVPWQNFSNSAVVHANKKLCYCRGTARGTRQ